MEQFGYKIAYNSLTRDFQTGIKNMVEFIVLSFEILLWSATEQVIGN